MGRRYFPEKIVKWYQENKRSLPWRETKDPYKIWLSEIILQQTRVAQGLPYYLRFIEKYPTVKKLAQADEHDVLRLWQGLGYYSRARNLHKCAKTIVHAYDGKFPTNYMSLLQLPGVGSYTAAAIASISFGEKVAVIDGNVFRVVSRHFGVDEPINSPGGKKTFAALANELINLTDEPDYYNQALMEFGALFCTPQRPNCEECIFQKTCVAYKERRVSALPVKIKAKASRKRYFYYFVLEHNGRLVMRRRDEKDIWLGLFDFHLIERKRPTSPETLMDDASVRKWVQSAEEIQITKPYKHILTHQTIFSRFIIIKNRKKPVEFERGHNAYSLKQIDTLPKPVLVSKFLSDHYIL